MRARAERRVFEVRARVITAVLEDDQDIHLVVAPRDDKGKTMIVEFPDSACVGSPFERDEIDSARQAMLDECGSLSSSSFTDLRALFEPSQARIIDL